MLTSDLVRARVKGRTLDPGLVQATRRDLMEPAAELVDTMTRAVEQGWSLGETTDALGTVGASSRSHKVIRGLAKLLVDRCEIDVSAPMPPVELRARVFRLARERGPLALEDDALGRTTASMVLAEVGEALGLDAAAVGRALYADRRDEQVLVGWRGLTAEALLHRYNVALVQALLLKATRVTVTIERPSVGRIRQLLRHVKFHQLVHRARRTGEGLTIEVDGPSSLFKQSTRYGLQLATFFPAVLLQEGPWKVEAEVLWTKAKHRKQLVVTHLDGLVSHYADTGAYTPREVSWFRERWDAKAPEGWILSDDTVPIELGGHGVVLPDFTFRKDGKEAHLEVVGFWRKGWLGTRLEGLRRHGPGNLVLAVSTKLMGDDGSLADVPGEVVPFAQVVPVSEVVAALERVAK